MMIVIAAQIGRKIKKRGYLKEKKSQLQVPWNKAFSRVSWLSHLFVYRVKLKI